MIESTEWPDDNLIDELVDRMVAEIRELVIHELPDLSGPLAEMVVKTPGGLSSVHTRLTVDAYELLTLSPPAIWAAYYDIAPASGEAYNTEINGAITAVESSIADWEGDAAAAFTLHVGNLREFMKYQTGHYPVEMLRSLAAAYKLAVLIREDFHTLVDVWIRTSQEFRAADDERRRSVKLKVGVILVAGVVGAVFAPTALAAGLTLGAAGIGAVTEEITGELGGQDADDIFGSYQRMYDQLRDSYHRNLEDLRKDIERQEDEISRQEVHLYDPLPTSCDVDSPDFRYENFLHDFTPTPTPAHEYDGKVEAERKKNLAEKNGPQGLVQDGPISRALIGERLTGAEVTDA